MKKRIISIALVVVMLVAMIPATLLTASAVGKQGYLDGHDVYISESNPNVDGVMDSVYLNSEKILSAYRHTIGNGVYYEAYVVVTNSGLYVYADVKDSSVDVTYEKGLSDVKLGDKLQVYLQIGNDTVVTEGEGDEATSTVTETQYAMTYCDFDYAHATSSQSKGSAASTITSEGYSIEINIPWSIFTGITNGITTDTLHLWFGLQCNDYAGDDGKTNNGIVCDNPNTSGYWTGYSCSGTTAPSKYMCPANLITTKSATVANNDLKYTTFVTEETITLDGERDDIYLLSEEITSKHIAVGTYGETTGFSTYMVATNDGIYVFASIYDDTLDKAEAVEAGLRAQDGDKFQIYLQFGNHAWNRWGYIDFDYLDGGRHLTTKQTLGYSTDGIQQKAVIWDDEKGWDIEIFIPNSISVDHSQLTSSTYSLKDVVLKMNFQALNETCTDWGEDGKATARDRHGLSYDIAAAGSAWNGPDHKSAHFVPVDFSLNPISNPGTGVVTYGPSVTIDGVKDDIYGNDSTAFILDRYASSPCSTHATKASAKAWVAVTDTKVTLYAQIYDETATNDSATANDDIKFYVYFPLTHTTTYTGYGYVTNRGHISTRSVWAASSKPFLSTNGVGTSSGDGWSRKYLGDNVYAVEMALDLPYAERAALAAGKTINLGIAISHLDCCGDAGTTTCGTAQNLANWYWSEPKEDQLVYRSRGPQYPVSKLSTPANFEGTPVISGANVALGESIAVNYFANVPAYAKGTMMKFTYNGTVTYVPGVASNAAGTQYKFTFEGVTPQCMGNNIKAELYVAGVKVDALDNYSVLQNCQNLLALEGEEAISAEAEQLIYDLLAYGAAAQNYKNYKTDNLVNKSYEYNSYEWIFDGEIVCNDKQVGAANVEGAKFSAAGVHYNYVNKVYAKIAVTTADVDALTVTIDGVEADLISCGNGEYIVYTDGVAVTDFDKVFTFVLSDGENSQTVTYSVNAYAAAKWAYSDEEDLNGALALALYGYGVAAEAYAASLAN